MKIEIAANSVASALAAQEGGAQRIELCAALEIGGLTPSHAQIALARDRIHIPMYVLIRPRCGDFVYDDLEFRTMLKDIETCVALGCDGVVIGALDERGYIDMDRCAEMISAAGKLGVTFHRAFDVSRDLRHALENIIALGCERVLTSGGEATALAGASLIRQLVEQANGRISVMPGAGINTTNIATLREQTGASEFHASAKRTLPSRMPNPRNLSGMIEGESRTDVEHVRALVAAVSAS
jgi:copper homeostasis protein